MHLNFEKSISAYLFAYFLVSLLLSLAILTRLLSASALTLDVKLFNLVLYDFYYYAMPAIAVTFLIMLWCTQEPRKQHKNPKHPKIVLSVLALTLLSLNAFLYGFLDLLPIPSLFKYVFFSSFAPLMVYLYFKWRKPQNRYLGKKVSAVLLVIAIIVPYASAYTGFNYVLSTARTINGNSTRVAFVSEYLRDTMTSIWQGNKYVMLHRAQNDFLRYLMLGVGGCGEMAMASTQFLDGLGIESRTVAFPGEDHTLVEVNLNDSWLVVDPGYYGSELLTREERGLRRIKEFGGLSYVIAFKGNMFIELTPYYVQTDTLIIRVTYSGEALANAEISLKHTFLGRETRLPDQENMFYSDGNGTIELHMGSMTYNEKAGPAEPYYWIYVNGRNTGYNVTSTGSGKIRYVAIDLAKL